MELSNLKLEELNFEEFRNKSKANSWKGKRKNFGIENWGGEDNPHSFLTKELVKAIRDLYMFGYSQKQLVETFKISYGHLNGILTNKIWKV